MEERESAYADVPRDDDEKAFNDALEIISGGGRVSESVFREEDRDAGAVVLQQNGNPPAGVGEEPKGDGQKGAESVPGDNSEWLESVLGGGGNAPTGELKASAVEGSAPKAEVTDEAGLDEDVVGAVMEELKGDKAFGDDFEIFGDDYRKQGKVAEAIVRKVLSKMNLDRVTKAADHIEQMERESVRNDWERQVEGAVPGWRDIINRDSRFPEWFDRQSERTKDCLRTASTADDAIFALQKFQFDIGQRSNTIENMRSVYGNPANERNTARFNAGGQWDGPQSEEEFFDDAVKAVYKGRPK